MNKEHTYIKIFSWRLSITGALAGALFFALSLLPSMLPRGYLFQGLASGIAFITGYALGVLVVWLWHYLRIPLFKSTARKIVISVVGALTAVTVAVALWQFVGWQNSVRAVFGEESINASFILPMMLIALFFAALLLIIGRSIRKLYQFVSAKLGHLLPRRIAVVLGVVLVVVLLQFIYNGVLSKAFFGAANSIFSTKDTSIDPDLVVPNSPLKSGSPQSLAAWDTLGRQGRKFVATGPSADKITEVTGQSAMEPIRVYAGLKSAETIEDRANLVLQELLRTGAFNRQSLLVTTTTGTGWLDPQAVDTFELVNSGDTAIVGVQYSYLPSWISLLADQQTAKDVSRAVFNKIYDYWATLPETERPKFYVYGLSLGSYGMETVLNSVELVNQPIDGALLAGPPFVNEMHKELERKRDVGSPAWLPIINNGQTVRFTAAENELNKPTGVWGNTKIVYMQHATDPMVWFSKDLLLSEPDWLKEGQRGPGITADFAWVPLVTFWQIAADMPMAGNVAPGYGHNYAASSNVDAWAALTQPTGWSEEKANTLKHYVQNAYITD